MELILLLKSEYLEPLSRGLRLFARPLVKPPSAAFQGLQAEERALHTRRRERDPEALDDVVAIDRPELVVRLPAHVVGEDRRRGLRDGAALSGECDVIDPIVRPDLEEHRDLVAAERVRVVVAVRRAG